MKRSVGVVARRLLLDFWAIALLVVLWQAIVTLSGVNLIVAPSPLLVASDISAHWDLYWQALLDTIVVALVGLFLGVAIGTTLAVIGWLIDAAAPAVAVILLMLRSVPIVIFVPIIAGVLGYNTGMTVAVVTIISLFPSFVLVSSGLLHLPRAYDDLARVFGVGKLGRLRYLALPAVTPALFEAIRICASGAVLAAMVAQFLTNVPGLGEIFDLSRGQLMTARAWGASIVAAALALCLYGIASWTSTRVRLRMT